MGVDGKAAAVPDVCGEETDPVLGERGGRGMGDDYCVDDEEHGALCCQVCVEVIDGDSLGSRERARRKWDFILACIYHSVHKIHPLAGLSYN